MVFISCWFLSLAALRGRVLAPVIKILLVGIILSFLICVATPVTSSEPGLSAPTVGFAAPNQDYELRTRIADLNAPLGFLTGGILVLWLASVTFCILPQQTLGPSSFYPPI